MGALTALVPSPGKSQSVPAMVVMTWHQTGETHARMRTPLKKLRMKP